MASLATYGSFSHEPNEANLVSMSSQVRFGPRNKTLSQTKTVSLFGEIQASSVTAIISRINEIETAYSTNRLDFRYTVDGSLAHSLLNGGSSSGVTVTSRSFPRGDGAELATKRSFAITLQATYDVAGADSELVSWTESIETIGTGGPKFEIVDTVNGPVAVYIAVRSIQSYHQTGMAVGYTTYPDPPGPVNPAGEMLDRRRISRISGRNMGNQIRFFTTKWSYFMIRDVGAFGEVDYFPTSQ